uniref:Lipoprotein n=1 Tax=Steinernema glaseri TaxID=37863 RepID=A0A1I8A6P9_9BILA
MMIWEDCKETVKRFGETGSADQRTLFPMAGLQNNNKNASNNWEMGNQFHGGHDESLIKGRRGRFEVVTMKILARFLLTVIALSVQTCNPLVNTDRNDRPTTSSSEQELMELKGQRDAILERLEQYEKNISEKENALKGLKEEYDDTKKAEMQMKRARIAKYRAAAQVRSDAAALGKAITGNLADLKKTDEEKYNKFTMAVAALVSGKEAEKAMALATVKGLITMPEFAKHIKKEHIMMFADLAKKYEETNKDFIENGQEVKNLEKDVKAYDQAINNYEKLGKELKDLKSAKAEDQKKLANVTNQLKELEKKKN